MSSSKFAQIVTWISNVFLTVSAFLARPFLSSSPPEILPIASPVAPSTPSFIQNQEPDVSALVDAMKIFQLESGKPRASRIARHKMAVKEAHNGPPAGLHLSQTLSITPTDPSPGFSVLSMVAHNLAPVSSDADSPSLYSSPPSTPSRSINTPSIVVSNTLGQFPPVHDEEEQECMLTRDIRTIPPRKSEDGNCPSQQGFRPSVADLAKRRLMSKPPPIMTDIPKDLFIPTRCTTPVKDSDQEEVDSEDLHLLSPKSAISAVSGFVRSSSTPKSPTRSHKRVSSRESHPASPDTQDAISEYSPFSTYSDSFYIDDHVASPQMVETDIYNLSFYSDIESTLNLSTKRRRQHRISHIPSTIEEEPARPMEERSFNSTMFSEVANEEETNVSPLGSPLFKADKFDESFLPAMSLDDLRYVEPSSSFDHESSPPQEALVLDHSLLERLNLYSAQCLPFELEDEIPLDVCPDLRRPKDIPAQTLAPGFKTRAPRPISLDSYCAGVAFAGSPDLSDSSPSTKRRHSLASTELLGRKDQTPLRSSLSRFQDRSPGNASPPAVTISPLSIKKKNRSRNRSVTIVQPSGQLETSIDEYMQMPTKSTSHSLESTSDDSLGNPASVLAATPDTALAEESTPSATFSPVGSTSSVDSILASPESVSEAFTPDVTSSTGDIKPKQGDKFGLLPDGVESLMREDIEQVQVDVLPTSRSRSRRIGIYGGLPQSMTSGLCIDDSEGGTEYASYAVQEESSALHSPPSKRGSALRPLVLPLQVARRESLHAATVPGINLSASQSNTSFHSTRSSIGLPPAQPLPEVPSRESPTKGLAALLASSRSDAKRLNSLIDLLEEMDFTAEDDRYIAERNQAHKHATTATGSADDSAENDHHVSWGIAL